MKLNKEEILGKALKAYLSKNYCNEIDKMIDIHTFSGVVYSVLEVIEKIDKEPIVEEILDRYAIRDMANNIKGYETKRLYKDAKDANKALDMIGEHITKRLQEALQRKGY